MSYLNPMLLADFYKLSHRVQYPEGTEYVYSTWTPRKSRIEGIDEVVNFGVQYVCKAFLQDYFNDNFFNKPIEEVLKDYVRVVKSALGDENPDTSHIEALHKLGYLPIRLRSLPEGVQVPIKVPMITVENTHPDFFWVTNYLETLISSEIWQMATSATLAKRYRTILDRYADKTVGSIDGVPVQLHDFAQRGMGGIIAAANSGAGHLLSFIGTDTIPAIQFLEKYYNANVDNEIVGVSIPATEHSVMCANADENLDEYDSIKRLLTKTYPTGFFSAVCDSYDFWNVVSKTLPSLKDEIMNRDGRMVVRPDSGDPVDILCGHDLPDFSKSKDLSGAIERMHQHLVSEAVSLVDEQNHMAKNVYGGIFKFEEAYYALEVRIYWSNFINTAGTYVSDTEIKSCTKVTPIDEVLGLVESLWNTFGGTITEEGYKLLDEHIGIIYGDSITLERAEEICRRLEKKGFASTNVVLGVGSYTYQYVTRDTFGFAMKATHATINGEEKLIFKDPKTDDGTKRSQRGRVAVVEIDGKLEVVDGLSKKAHAGNFTNLDHMRTVFVDGELIVEDDLKSIRQRLGGF